MFIVYKITHDATGRYYIGKTVRYLWERGYMGSGVIIKGLVDKYGRDAFTREILFETKDERKAYSYERGAVGLAFGLDPLCLNLKSGGSGGEFGQKVSAETREKLRRRSMGNKHSLGFKQSVETRTKKSIANKGENNPFHGRKHTMETKLKMRRPFTLRGIRFGCNQEAREYFGVCDNTVLNWKRKENASG